MKRVILTIFVAALLMMNGCDDKDKGVAVTDITFAEERITLEVGETKTLEYSIEPKNATDTDVVWNSDRENVAVVSETGEVIALTEGFATITVTTVKGNIMDFCFVEVVPATEISLNKTTLNLVSGKSETLTATVVPAAAVTWSSSKEDVATVVNGVITGGIAGTAIITATAGKQSATCAVTVFDSPKSGDVFVAGTHGRDAVIWKNGIMQNLTYNGTMNYAEARSVHGSGSDVYVAGYGNYNAILWKNYVAENLTDGTREAKANSVYISDSKLYVAGDERNAQNNSVAKLWTNGVGQDLSDGTNALSAKSVYVSGNNVYVTVSRDDNNSVASLWINGETQNLINSTQSQSVYVSGADWYVAGSDYSGRGIARLWKNGILQNLDLGTDVTYTNASHANAVHVSGEDVYVAGRQGNFNFGTNYFAKLWINGEVQNLTESTGVTGTNAMSVYVSGSNVYVAGYGRNAQDVQVPILWVNGVAQILPSETTENARAYSVFVIE